MGTPDFAVAALDALHAAGHDIVAVYCQPPRPAGRGHKLQPSPVQRRAEELGLPVRAPASLKKDPQAVADFKALDLDVAIVAAYGLILPQTVLDAPKHGCINIHASLLPRWRGAAPIERALLAGDAETGICIMQMEAGLDTGPVLMRDSLPITAQSTSRTLHDDLAAMGGRLVVETLADLGDITPVPQDDAQAVYAKMLDKNDARIDWQHPAADIERQLRAFAMRGGLWCMAGGARMKITAAETAQGRGQAGEILDRHLVVACGDGALRLLQVQPENRKPMDGASFMNGGGIDVGDILA